MASESDNMGYKVKHVEVTLCMSPDCPRDPGPYHRYCCSMCRMGAGRHSKRCDHTFGLMTANNEGPGVFGRNGLGHKGKHFHYEEPSVKKQ